MTASIASAFVDAMRSSLGTAPDDIIADAQRHRFSTRHDRPNDKSGWYILYPDGIPAGAFGDWRTGLSETWRYSNGKVYAAGEEAAWCARLGELRAQREAEEAERQAEAATRAAEIWASAAPALAEHPYLVSKRVSPYGIRMQRGRLVVPMRDAEGNLHSLQFIAADGEKRFLTGGRVQGCYYAIGAPGDPICIAEGFATAASLHEATGHAAVVAINAGNLLPVAQAIRYQHVTARIVLCADDDYRTDRNPGLTAATEAARAVGALLAIPDFGARRPEGATDFNDLAAHRGLEAVALAVASAVVPEHAKPETDDQAIARLARLSVIEYERCRDAEAVRMGVRVGILDRLVARERPAPDGEQTGAGVTFPELETWPTPVDGADLLDDLVATARRHVILPAHTDTAVALWLLLTYLIDAVQVAPILGITSPEKRCGKSTLLFLALRLACRTIPASNISPAALYRAVELWQPTLVIDEADTFLRDNEELRGILNSGHTRDTAYVIRTVGDDHEPRRFSTWGPKAIALIGSLPETLHDRSIVIALRRRLPHETAEKVRHADPAVFGRLARQCLRWATDHAETIRRARPRMPDALHDRAADNWEPLLAIADLAGGEWPARARTAALALSGVPSDDTESIRVQLLRDISELFAERGASHLRTADIIEALNRMESRPWTEANRGRPINGHWLARRLGGFGVRPHDVKIEGKGIKSYRRADLDDAFARYIPDAQARLRDELVSTRVSADFAFATEDEGSRLANSVEPAPHKAGRGVADRNPPAGGDEGINLPDRCAGRYRRVL